MSRWDDDDFQTGRMIALFSELDEQKKKILCDVAEQMVIDIRKNKHNDDALKEQK